jgi:hypothetical protein
MTDQIFEAQSLVETRTRGENFEMVFADMNGNRQAITLPLGLAADILVPVLDQLRRSAERLIGSPEFVKNVTSWQVGRSNQYPHVLLKVNDEVPLAFDLPDAKKLWREIREEAEAVERRPRPVQN